MTSKEPSVKYRENTGEDKMAAFKSGVSGNPTGRPKGALNKRTELTKLLEPHAEALISKMIAMALDGDAVALRLCMERLMPKARYESTGIELPKKIKAETIEEIRLKLAQAILDGKMGASDAEIVLRILTNNPDAQEPKEIDTSMITDEEAENMYKAVMNGKIY